MEEVRLSIERVLLGVDDVSCLASNNSALVFSGAGDAGTDDSVEVGERSNIDRGTGRRICSAMLDVEHMACTARWINMAGDARVQFWCYEGRVQGCNWGEGESVLILSFRGSGQHFTASRCVTMTSNEAKPRDRQVSTKSLKEHVNTSVERCGDEFGRVLTQNFPCRNDAPAPTMPEI